MDGSLSVNSLSVKKLIRAKNDSIYDIFNVLGGFWGRTVDWDGRGRPRVASYQ